MSQHTAPTTSAPKSKSRSLIGGLLSLALLVGIFIWLDQRWHITDHLPPVQPDQHLIAEAKDVLGETLENREQRLLNHVRRNPDAGIDEVRNTVSTYQSRIRRLDGGSQPPFAVIPSPLASSGQTSIVVHDAKYDTTERTKFHPLPSDTQNGEYRYWVPANILKNDLPRIPAAGEVWEFSFSRDLGLRI